MKEIIALAVLLALTACNPQDPSKYDLKSPCVSVGGGYDDPCVERPLLNNNPRLENITG